MSGREVIISMEDHEAENSAYLSKLPTGQGLILNMGGMLSPLTHNEHQSIGEGECLTLNEALAIDRTACLLAQTWYGGTAEPKHRGISVGNLVAYEVWRWFILAMKIALIITHLRKKMGAEALVLTGDGSHISKITAAIADAYAVPVKWLVSKSNGNDSQYIGRSSLRKTITSIARFGYERFHSGRNFLANFSSFVKPGFQRPNGLRCILFDPYNGFEKLLPELFGSACAHIVIPYSNFRAMPRILHFQKSFGISTCYFHRPVNPAEGVDVKELTGSLTARLEKLYPPPDLPGLEALWATLLNELREHIGRLIPKACAEINAAELIIRKHGIDATVLPYDEFGLYKALALVGRRDGLLTIQYQHGVPNRYPAFIPPTSEKVVVWNQEAREFFNARGVADRRIALLPNPTLPMLRTKAQQIDQKMARRKFELENAQPIAFFAMQPFTGLTALDNQSQTNDILKTMINVCRVVPDCYFLFKLHPNDAKTGKRARVQGLVDEAGLSNVKVLALGDSHELIVASDVAISETSTCLWEATVLDRPAVAFVVRDLTRQLFPYKSTSGIVRVDSVEALIKVLRDVVVRKGGFGAASSHAPNEIVRTNSIQPGYFDDPRWELFSLIPSKTKTMLDVGCGGGWLGQKIKATRPCLVIGIEGNPEAAKMASRVLDAVFAANVETFSLPFHLHVFDCIVFADILEHLRDPWETLRRYVEFLHDDGVVVISIPNIGHYTTLLSLVRGHWEYKAEGILDRTHLRFFTRKGIEDLLYRAGLCPIRILRNTHAGRKMRTANLLSGNRLADLITFQYLVVAKRC